MCEWCGDKRPEERQRLVEAGRHSSRDLRRLASYYEGLGKGSVEPHNARTIDAIKPIARSVLRQLFEDWF